MVPKTFSKAAMKHLSNMDWTGNVRQLRNVVERLYILGSNPITGGEAEQYA